MELPDNWIAWVMRGHTHRMRGKRGKEEGLKRVGDYRLNGDQLQDVSESIKSLVAAIRDAAPGQAELDSTISRLEQVKLSSFHCFVMLLPTVNLTVL